MNDKEKAEREFKKQNIELLKQNQFALKISKNTLETDIRYYKTEEAKYTKFLYEIREEKYTKIDKLNTMMNEIKVKEEKIGLINNQIDKFKPKDYITIDPAEIKLQDYEQFIRKNVNLAEHTIFQGEQYKNPRKSAALKGEIGLLLTDFAYLTYDISHYSETITKVSKNLKIDVGREKSTMELKVKFETEFSEFKITGEMKFMDLLINVARYWSLEYTEFVLIDNLYNMWPYDNNVMNEQISYKLNPTNFLGEDIVITLFQIEKLRKKYLNLELGANQILEEETKYEMVAATEDVYRKDFVEEKIEYEKSIGEIYEEIVAYILKKIIIASGEDYNDSTKTRLEDQVCHFLGISVYFIFIATLVLIVQLDHNFHIMYSHTKNFQKTFLLQNFRLSNGESKNFYNLVNRIETLDYIQSALQIYYQDKNYNGKSFTSQQLQTFRDFNFILGKARLRQKRVKPNSCTPIIGVKGLGPTNLKCYDSYSKTSEEKSQMNIVLLDFWMNYTSPELTTFTHSAFSGPDRNTAGNLYDYDMSGYISYAEKNFLWNSSASTKYLNFFKLYPDKIWDARTRALILEINYYVPNTDFVVAAELVFEQLPTGSVETIARVVPFRVDTTYNSDDKIRALLELAWLAILIIIILSMFPSIFIRKIRRHGCKAILKAAGKIAIKPWSIMTFFLLGLAIARMLFKGIFKSLPVIATLNYFNFEYKDMMSAGNVYEQILLIDGLSGFFSVFLVFKYLSESTTIIILWKTLSEGKRIFFWFLTMFIIMYIGYVFIGYFFFGQFLSNYNTVGGTFETLINGPVGRFNYFELWKIDTITAPIFFLVFIIPMYFVLTKIFLAIFLERYESTVAKVKKLKKYDRFYEIIFGGWIMFRAFIIFPISLIFLVLGYPIKRIYRNYSSKKRFKKLERETFKKDKKKAEREKLTKWMKEGDVEMKGKYTTSDELDEEERLEKERKKMMKKKNAVIEEKDEEEEEDED